MDVGVSVFFSILGALSELWKRSCYNQKTWMANASMRDRNVFWDSLPRCTLGLIFCWLTRPNPLRNFRSASRKKHWSPSKNHLKHINPSTTITIFVSIVTKHLILRFKVTLNIFKHSRTTPLWSSHVSPVVPHRSTAPAAFVKTNGPSPLGRVGQGQGHAVDAHEIQLRPVKRLGWDSYVAMLLGATKKHPVFFTGL